MTPTLTSRGPVDMKVFEKIFSVNLLGAIYVAKYAAVQMAKNAAINEQGEKGVILFVSSVQAREGQRAQTGYSASKGAVSGLVLPMARDLGRYGIRALAIAAGTFDTPMVGFIPKKSLQNIESQFPMGSIGRPE